MVEDRGTTITDRATVVIAIILGGAALYVASDFFIPVTLSFLLSALLWPVVKQLKRWHIPTAAGAAICILGTVAILVAAVSGFEPPVRKFANEIPKSIAKARPKLASMSASFSKIMGSPARKTSAPATPTGTTKNPGSTSSADSTARATGNRVAATNSGSDSAASARGDSAAPVRDSADSARSTDSATAASSKTDTGTTSNGDSTPRSKAKPATDKPINAGSSFDLSTISSGAPATIGKALGVASSLLGDFLEIILLSLFVLAAGDAWRVRLEKAVASRPRQTAVADTVGEMRAVVSQYVVMLAAINVIQGVVISVALYFLGYPTPWLWGVLAFMFEFIPYFGGMLVIALLLVAGLGAGRGFPSALAGPAVYLITTSLQNNIVSPIAYGRRLRLNPAAILAGLMLWYMLWGVAGAFLAVPLLAAFNVLATRIPSLRGIGEFISD